MVEIARLVFAGLLPFVVGYINQLAIPARYRKEKNDG